MAHVLNAACDLFMYSSEANKGFNILKTLLNKTGTQRRICNRLYVACKT